MTIRVRDLKDQFGTLAPHPMLKCFRCGNEYSADAGDYFIQSPDHIFKHCGRNMALVVRRVTYEEVR